MTEKEIIEKLHSNYYIVDCKNFIYYVKKIKIIGYGYEYNSNIDFMITPEWSVPAREIYKNYEEAEKIAKKLNDIKENKERAIKWNSYENMKKMIEMEGLI